MNTKKLQKGFTIVEIALVIIIVAVASGSAWYVAKHNKSAKKSVTTSLTTTTPPSASTGATTNSAELSTYENKDLGFKFSYPKSYGAINLMTVTDLNSAKAYTVQFANRNHDKNNLVAVTMENSNYERGGIGSVCNLGVNLPDATYTTIAPLTGSWVSSRSIVSESNISGRESVSFPENITDGSTTDCPDAEITISKQITNNANFEAVKVYMSYRSPEAGKLNSQAEYDALYASSPNSFVTAAQRDELIAIAKSFTNL